MKKHLAMLALTSTFATCTLADEPGLFDGMNEAVNRSLQEQHAARQANGGQPLPKENAEPGLFDGMTEAVSRSLEEQHAARQQREQDSQGE